MDWEENPYCKENAERSLMAMEDEKKNKVMNAVLNRIWQEKKLDVSLKDVCSIVAMTMEEVEKATET